ncbi:MAG: hypothetical protein V4508_03145 [Pseudomonadota bacterium]
MVNKTPRTLLLCSALACVFWAQSAHALRPYDGTDASVTEPGVFELEFSPIGQVRNGHQRTLVAPFVVANLGLDNDTEVVLEGKVFRQQGAEPEGYRTSMGDTTLSLKHLFRHGSMQEEGTGVSIAAECGILLPEIHDAKGTGAVCSGIASQRFALATFHLNAGLSWTRAHTQGRILGLIVEGPGDATVRPVMEVLTEHESAGAHTDSALVGLIWKHAEDLVFDIGVRKARTDGQALTELRAGLTWSFAWHK